MKKQLEKTFSQIPAEIDNTEKMKKYCESEHPVVIAETLSSLSPEEGWQILCHANQPVQGEIFSHMNFDAQEGVIRILGRKEISNLLTDMPPDDRAALVKKLPEEMKEKILPAMSHAEREDIRRLSSYRENTAGSVMTSDYAVLSPDLTAGQAIEKLREVAPDRETIYCAYVVNNKRQLIGYVSLKDLILAWRNVRVSEIMEKDIIYANVDDDKEDAARKIQKFDLIALPVTNGGNSLVGIITHDDAIDIITQEYTEDMEKLMAIAGSHESGVYLKTPSWKHFKNRAAWVCLLAVFGLVSGFIVQNFEGMLMQFTILAVFMPMLADTGGNTGSQAATLVIRALALQEITSKDIFRIIWKEAKVSIMLGLLLAVIAFARVMVFGGKTGIPEGFSHVAVATAISAALCMQVVTSTVIGAILPLAASHMKLDPAVVASPAVTTIVDITGLLIYFTTAKVLLGF